MKVTWFHRYLLPGFVFQSVVVAGGYGTGQEILQYFLSLGPIEGLLGMLVASLCWSLVCILSYEFARIHRALDYRTFFKKLLGRGWILFEFSYLLVLLLVLSIVGASCGHIGEMQFGMSYNVSILCILLYICYLVLKGSRTIERMFSIWSALLYGVFFLLFVAFFSTFSTQIKMQLQTPMVNYDWIQSGFRYAFYNLGFIPAVFFTLRHLQTRKQAIVSGFITGPISIFPAVLLYLSMLSYYPDILNQVIPSTYLLEMLDNTFLKLAFTIVLLGTLIETGVGLIHAFNQRLETQFEEVQRQMPSFFRPLVAIIILALSMLLAQFGLVTLISKGYGMLTWVIFAIFILPLIIYWCYCGIRALNPFQGRAANL